MDFIFGLAVVLLLGGIVFAMTCACCLLHDIHNELREIRLRIKDDKGAMIGPHQWRKP